MMLLLWRPPLSLLHYLTSHTRIRISTEPIWWQMMFLPLMLKWPQKEVSFQGKLGMHVWSLFPSSNTKKVGKWIRYNYRRSRFDTSRSHPLLPSVFFLAGFFFWLVQVWWCVHLAALVHFTDMSLLNFVHAAVLVVPQVMLNVGYRKQNVGEFSTTFC